MSRPPRQSESGWALAGSQRHIQAYVNTAALQTELEERLRAELDLGERELEWRAPLADRRYEEPRDQTFWPAIERDDLMPSFSEWWPARGGPAWDALALARATGSDLATAILIEAKAHPMEFVGPGMGATSARSIAKIKSALDECRLALGARAPLDVWTSSHYQLANRLAWAWKLTEAGQPTVFTYVGFAWDRSNIVASGTEIAAAAAESFSALGLDSTGIPGLAYSVVLPATG